MTKSKHKDYTGKVVIAAQGCGNRPYSTATERSMLQAIAKNVIWLPQAVRDILHHDYILVATSAELEKALIAPYDDFSDWRLKHASYTLYVNWYRASGMEAALADPNSLFLIHVRISHKNFLFVALVTIVSEERREESLKYSRLIPPFTYNPTKDINHE